MRSMTSRVESEYNIALDQDEVEENAFQEVGGRVPLLCCWLVASYMAQNPGLKHAYATSH
jgi:hypothetical protein